MVTLYYKSAMPTEEHPYDFVVVNEEDAELLKDVGWVTSPDLL
ncbi:hypothetical protein T751_00158 [Klebsiella phage T751]|nr:hypothetical protein T751_00158 [Klebsiella phage T751]URG18040.1 hypothetical protein T765_00202 [Klebsiella phage T765]